MGDPMDLAPPVGVGLARVAQELLETRREHLGPAPRHGVQPGPPEAGQGLPGLDLEAPPPVIHLGRGERLDLCLGPGDMDGLDQPLVILEGPVGVVTADDVDLARAGPDHAEHVFDGMFEGAVLALLAREVAEAARQHAEIGGVHVTVHHEEDLVPVAA